MDREKVKEKILLQKLNLKLEKIAIFFERELLKGTAFRLALAALMQYLIKYDKTANLALMYQPVMLVERQVGHSLCKQKIDIIEGEANWAKMMSPGGKLRALAFHQPEK